MGTSQRINEWLLTHNPMGLMLVGFGVLLVVMGLVLMWAGWLELDSV